MIHIGKNNVVAKIFSDAGWQCFGHDENFDDEQLDQRYVSISAFSPTDKTTPANFKYEKNLFEKLKVAKHVLYVSSLRTLEIDTDKSIRTYVQNKKRIEFLAREYCSHVSILRLPNIIDRSRYYQSRFQQILLKNLIRREINFDISAKSKFNFLTNQKIKKWLINQGACFEGDYNLANKYNISAREIANIIKMHHKIDHESYNENRDIKLKMPIKTDLIYLDDSKISYQDLVGA